MRVRHVLLVFPVSWRRRGQISNEFKFTIAAFHHAHETYLIPDTLKSAYGRPPAAALFATHARYKRESYRGSEFAPRILAENGIQVVMKVCSLYALRLWT